MARVWNLVDTLADVTTVKPRGTSDGANYLYFVIVDDVLGYDVVYRWSPTFGFTDISGNTFIDTDYSVQELCWFGSALFARVVHAVVGGYDCEIYTWTGGTNWSLVDTFGTYSLATSGIGDLECDATKIVCINRDNVTTHLHMSTDGVTWVECTANGGAFDDTTQHLIGLTRNTAQDLSDGVIFNDQMNDCWAWDAGVDWQKVNLGASTVGGPLTGYLALESQFSSAIGSKMKRSGDWGVTFTTTNGFANFEGRYTYAQSFLDYEAFSESLATIYAYDSGTDTWADDGSVAEVVKLLFRISSTLYILTGDAAAVTAKIYEGGAVTPPAPPVAGYHVVTTIDSGANWTTIINNWGADYCSSLLALPKSGANRQLVAVKAAATAEVFAGVNSLSYEDDFTGATATPTDGIAQGNDNKTYIAAADDALIIRSDDYFATQSDYKTGLTAAVGLTSIKKV